MFEIGFDWEFSGSWMDKVCRSPEMHQFNLKCENNSLIRLTPRLGSGYLEHVELEKDKLGVILYDCVLKNDAIVTWATNLRIYGFYFDFSEGMAIAHLAPFIRDKDQYFVSYSAPPSDGGKPANYKFEIEAGIPVKCINILVEENFFLKMSEQWDSDILKQDKDFFSFEKFSGCTAIHKDMFRIFQEAANKNLEPAFNVFERLHLKANIYRLLYLFLGHLLYKNKLYKEDSSDAEKRLIILDRMIQNERLDNLPEITEAAREVAMSTSKFKTLFKKVFGNSYYQFYKEIRLKKARELITNKKIDLQDIALMLGYKTTNSFIKAFTLKYDVSPLVYRKRSAISKNTTS